MSLTFYFSNSVTSIVFFTNPLDRKPSTKAIAENGTKQAIYDADINPRI